LEAIVFRTFAVATILALTVSVAQADDSADLTARVHDAAVKACAAKVGDNRRMSFYGAVFDHCVENVTADTLASIHAKEGTKDKTGASTAAN
jgi:hypothetical protein